MLGGLAISMATATDEVVVAVVSKGDVMLDVKETLYRVLPHVLWPRVVKELG